MVIPTERFSAAVFTYHLSILMSIVGITQVPYTAVIIGHEKKIYMLIRALLSPILRNYCLYIYSWFPIGIINALRFIAFCVVQCGITFFILLLYSSL